MRASLLSTPSSNSAGTGGGAKRGSAVSSSVRRLPIAIVFAITAGLISLPAKPAHAQDGQPPAQDAAGQNAAKPAETTPGQQPADASSSDIDGETMFATSCGFCHEQGGRVPGKGPKLQGTQRTDEFIINRIKTGKLGSMPAFGGAFTDGQIMAILAYIRGLEE
jgi:mono/diheme cytochrome c family protein